MLQAGDDLDAVFPGRLIQRLHHHPRDFDVIERCTVAGEDMRAECGDDFFRRGGWRKDDDPYAGPCLPHLPCERKIGADARLRIGDHDVHGARTNPLQGVRFTVAAFHAGFGWRSKLFQLGKERVLPADEENPGGGEREDPGGRHGP